MTPPEKKLTENERAKNALNSAYVNAESLGKEFEKLGLTKTQLGRIENITKPAGLKAVKTVSITLLTKKIISPSQDVRQHRDDLQNGFSGRTLDTKIITPFMLKKFGKHFAMAESGWLTRSFEQPYSFTLDYKGPIDKAVKKPFLEMLDDIEKGADSKKYLTALLAKLILKKKDFKN